MRILHLHVEPVADGISLNPYEIDTVKDELNSLSACFRKQNPGSYLSSRLSSIALSSNAVGSYVRDVSERLPQHASPPPSSGQERTNPSCFAERDMSIVFAIAERIAVVHA